MCAIFFTQSVQIFYAYCVKKNFFTVHGVLLQLFACTHKYIEEVGHYAHIDDCNASVKLEYVICVKSSTVSLEIMLLFRAEKLVN